MNRYVKIKDHPNWFLVLNPGQNEPDKFSENMQERILYDHIFTKHGDSERPDFSRRLMMIGTREIDYETISKKYKKTLIIRPTGSYIFLTDEEITDEVFNTHFPIDDDSFAEIVICENDKIAEPEWVSYLQKRFPSKKIATINFFSLRADSEVIEYFSKAKYITFSTTFSNLEWYEKLTKVINDSHEVIGFCHNEEKWQEAININSKVEIVKELK